MNREELKNILRKWYSKHTIESILGGRRKPKYENIIQMSSEHNIPFDAWTDIGQFINSMNHDTKQPSN